MREGWQTKNLGDLCQVIGGGTPPKDKSEYYTGDIPWATVRDMRQEVITETECKITKEAVKSSSTNIIPGGNVVIATRVGLGKVCLLGQDTAINQDLRGIVPINPKILSVQFLYWWLKNTADLIVAEGTGATVQGVKLPFIKSLQVPHIPLTEQQRITNILDEAFDGIATAKANAEKNLQNARALFESHLQSAFTQRGKGWVETTLGEVCTTVEYGSSAKSKERGKTPVLRMGNIQSGRFVWDKLVYSDDDSEINKYLLKYNDVLFNRTNSPELVGKTAIYKGEMRAIFAGYLMRIHRKETLLDADYLNYFLNSNIAKEYGKTVVISSVNQANINGQKLKSYPIPLPTLKEQQAIVVKLAALSEKTQRLESIYQQKLDALDALKKSLLDQAFTGQL
jgi:type I restriction enzyme, S subunit